MSTTRRPNYYYPPEELMDSRADIYPETITHTNPIVICQGSNVQTVEFSYADLADATLTEEKIDPSGFAGTELIDAEIPETDYSALDFSEPRLFEGNVTPQIKIIVKLFFSAAFNHASNDHLLAFLKASELLLQLSSEERLLAEKWVHGLLNHIDMGYVSCSQNFHDFLAYAVADHKLASELLDLVTQLRWLDQKDNLTLAVYRPVTLFPGVSSRSSQTSGCNPGTEEKPEASALQRFKRV